MLTRRAWIGLTLGLVAAYAAGAAVALAVQHSGGWRNGTSWDLEVLTRAHVSLPGWLDFVMVSVPWLGTNITIFAVLIPAGVRLWRHGRSDIVTPLSAACIGNYVLNTLLKLTFRRPRPTLWPRRGEYTWTSYPSGHAIAMLSVLLFLAWLLHREFDWHWPYVVWLPVFVSMMYSRVYLGVHWPTDVVGGLAVGTIWLLAVWLVFRRADRH